LPRAALLVPLGLLGMAALTARDYLVLEQGFYTAGTALHGEARNEALRALRAHSLLGPLAELIGPQAFVPMDAPARDKLALNSRLVHFAPIADTVYRQAALLAEDGQQQAAQLQFLRAARAYPHEREAYAQRLQLLAQDEPASYAALAQFARSLRQGAPLE
jgi:hypothetical protein